MIGILEGVKFSVLDRAAVSTQETEREALAGVLSHALHVEALGFQRFLVAEHHGVPGLPSGQPAVLATFVGAHTSAIRIGTAGIMAPTLPPVLIAEQVGMLASLFSGRVDIGIGSSAGFTAPVRAALRQGNPKELKAKYEETLWELNSYLTGSAPVTSYPRASAPMWVLAGPNSARIAAKLGWGIITGGPLALQERAISEYRKAFQGDAPAVMASFNIAVADDAATARQLLLPEAYEQALSQSTGVFGHLNPLPDVSRITPQQRSRMEAILARAIYGNPAEVAAKLQEISARLGVNEILVTGDIPDREGRAASEEMLAELRV